jgi:hypothetical protein
MYETNFTHFNDPCVLVFLTTGSVIAYDWNLGLYANEDDGPFINSDFVDPGWGGQQYDVERIGLYEDSTYVYFWTSNWI